QDEGRDEGSRQGLRAGPLPWGGTRLHAQRRRPAGQRRQPQGTRRGLGAGEDAAEEDLIPPPDAAVRPASLLGAGRQGRSANRAAGPDSGAFSFSSTRIPLPQGGSEPVRSEPSRRLSTP